MRCSSLKVLQWAAVGAMLGAMASTAQAQGSWVMKKPVPARLSEVTVAAIGGKIHVIGGSVLGFAAAIDFSQPTIAVIFHRTKQVGDFLFHEFLRSFTSVAVFPTQMRWVEPTQTRQHAFVESPFLLLAREFPGGNDCGRR